VFATNRIDVVSLPAGDRALMAPIAAAMYAIAGLLVAVTVLIVPHPDQMNSTGMLVLAAMGAGSAAAIWIWRDRWPLWFFQLSTAAGTVILGFAVYWGGSASSPYALLLVWVAVFSGYFCTPIQTAGQLTLAGIVYAIALAAHPQAESDAVAQWLLLMTAMALVAGMVTVLVSSRRRLEVEREELLTETLKLARTDPLTGLPNRRTWREDLDRELVRARRGGSVCVAMLDLDHFKEFNDEHGHVAGDALLQQLARAWATVVRPTDTLARYGGEEFALLLPACSMELATEVVERLRTMIPEGENCSAGLAGWDGEESPLELIARADARLYVAKGRGRDQLVATDSG
jgi:diguanylate cyclase (GGDEF)-like protein